LKIVDMVNGFMVNGYWKYIYCFHIYRFYAPIHRAPEINEKKKIFNPSVPPIANAPKPLNPLV